MRARGAGGYTLLEICLVLGLLAILAGMAIPSLSSLAREERLAQWTNSCRDMASSARRRAIDEGMPYTIRFQKGRITLEGTDKRVISSISIPWDLDLQVRGSGEGWKSASGQKWIFQNTGLLEYIEIKASIGAAWSQIAFNPLTATARETASNYP